MSDHSKRAAEAFLDQLEPMVSSSGTEDNIDDIYETPLSVDVRSAWTPAGQDLEPAEYMILLAVGGPAVCLIGELDIRGEPCTVDLQHQDWFEPWMSLPIRDNQAEALLEYARVLLPAR